ncbi:hypothetical protein Hypma_016213 [Hypsizygus marmoreus]|uniref:Uncharacterized protein n=1 Tax=Hypsizygus marmoreus TaxID=39966 RepID=A0A369IYL4_HYPMA|nr:hypothetical protein Hypma_016213 [Hypsizygus marmoreus]
MMQIAATITMDKNQISWDESMSITHAIVTTDLSMHMHFPIRFARRVENGTVRRAELSREVKKKAAKARKLEQEAKKRAKEAERAREEYRKKEQNIKQKEEETREKSGAVAKKELEATKKERGLLEENFAIVQANPTLAVPANNAVITIPACFDDFRSRRCPDLTTISLAIRASLVFSLHGAPQVIHPGNASLEMNRTYQQREHETYTSDRRQGAFWFKETLKRTRRSLRSPSLLHFYDQDFDVFSAHRSSLSSTSRHDATSTMSAPGHSAQPVRGPVTSLRLWCGNYVAQRGASSADPHLRVVECYEDLLREVGVIDLAYRAYEHSNGAKHKTLQGYDATGWMSFAIHLEQGGTPDAARQDALDIKLTRLYYAEKRTHKNFRGYMNTPV